MSGISTVSRARKLRRRLSLPEGMLWRVLKDRPADLKFRRQHPLGPYVLDFYCPAAKLAIEIDGIAHDLGGRPEADLRRDQWLRGKGLGVMKILATEVLADVETVVRGIVAECQKRSSL